jgi:hypothetical protein
MVSITFVLLKLEHKDPCHKIRLGIDFLRKIFSEKCIILLCYIAVFGPKRRKCSNLRRTKVIDTIVSREMMMTDQIPLCLER